ncbi:hypothetical protein [Brucella anthropi]|uniref:hypothetical protein n=1 Tax=Brucella anthropi TaxID=529 RepID=UPI000CFDA25F|nr:hypothetical protein [Ochrobactrum sp. MYb49]PQZ66763.1 hypothetical protein CQ057_09745 [Ochrobactrum sp. MYb49]
MSKELAELAFDLHSGLSSFDVPDFEDLSTVGMAATLAVHIKGLGEIKYDVLRGVCSYYMGIPTLALENILNVLSDIGFVRIIKSGRRIEAIIPDIPVFDDVYQGVGDYLKSDCRLNEHEQVTLDILKSLKEAPRNKDSLFNTLGADKKVFDRTLEIGTKSGIVSEHLARGKNILASPFYFADNLDGFADAAASAGANNIKKTLTHIQDNQGWPLSLIASRGEIGGTKLDPVQLSLVQKLSAEGVIKPPTIRFGGKTESFIFTPRPGGARLNAANREIYERAMALIAAVRKGQLLPDQYRIKSPTAILRKLRDQGYIGSSSEASNQYHNLVVLRVGGLRPSRYGFSFHLHKTPENESALSLAINLLSTGSMSGMEVNDDARLAMTKDENYIQSLISARELKSRAEFIKNEEADHEFQQLLLKFD